MLLIVLAQFLCTSLWFAGNGVSFDIIRAFQLNIKATSLLTSSVQFGFILGTLSFAVLSITDLFSPSKIFFICAVFGSIFNLGLLFDNNTLVSLIVFRFLTGFSLAGIYPIGIKIAADYFSKGLGKSLGWLVGALVLGTAFPHYLKLISTQYSWQYVIIIPSVLALIGGILVYLYIPKGPFFTSNNKANFKNLISIFKNQRFVKAAIGYFGHMWELYAFWTFIPLILGIYNKMHPQVNLSIPLYSFIIIGSGAIACILAGYLSVIFGTLKTATFFLIASGCCCIISPFIFSVNPSLFLSFLIFWGCVVIADSPLFSTLIAINTTNQTKGTAITIVNCIGFTISILSIQLLSYLQSHTNKNYIFLILAIGPIIGIRSLILKTRT